MSEREREGESGKESKKNEREKEQKINLFTSNYIETHLI